MKIINICAAKFCAGNVEAIDTLCGIKILGDRWAKWLINGPSAFRCTYANASL